MTTRQFEQLPKTFDNYAMVFLLMVALFTQSSNSPALAVNDGSVRPEAAESKPFDGDAKTRSIGTLHMSEGKVIIKQSQIWVLSDSKDSIEDAELAGVILDLHAAGDSEGATTNGIAFFTKGFSLPALDDPKLKESVKGNDGEVRVGRIEDVTAKMLRIKTAQGVQAIPTRYIVEIKSPRAFAFIMPEATATATGSIIGPSQAPNSFDPVAPSHEGLSLLSFNPTYVPDPNRAPPPNQVLALNKQLSKTNARKKLSNAAALAAGAAACFAIPIGIGLTCPPQR
jgi:hypothetical protein